MTFLEASFPYDPPIGQQELAALDGIRDVYGIRTVRFEEPLQRIVVEYDASRLTKSDIAFMLRGAGIRLQNPVGNVA
jgi:hypothetical protein